MNTVHRRVEEMRTPQREQPLCCPGELEINSPCNVLVYCTAQVWTRLKYSVSGGGTVGRGAEGVPHLYLTISVTRGDKTKTGGRPHRAHMAIKV
jgi:hypothetical protein